MESPKLIRLGTLDKDEHELDHERQGSGLDHDAIITSESEKGNVSAKDSEAMKNLGSQARLSSEARYTRFSEYVLRKISSQVLTYAKKGLWKAEIYLADSLWSRDPENQRRLLTALSKQELSAKIFPSHNKKIRILIWWSAEPPLHGTAPIASKNELADLDDKKKGKISD